MQTDICLQTIYKLWEWGSRTQLVIYIYTRVTVKSYYCSRYYISSPVVLSIPLACKALSHTVERFQRLCLHATCFVCFIFHVNF